ncbi:FG-GAP-like repeat-containing protein [Robiginitalea sp. SC105]|uniref:FG-GAP-like repeat-containing protein n=1 Tax=Robiginitalea sp. SC105 TaxID=2762332 RepID=UPI00163AE5B5|nr:FG-GAP-like repeat-containing protein [Robiginitalea sp. SC105]MBC2840283.1 VCBS repeat-containing protein [Robiginitalea sp. SC105]
MRTFPVLSLLLLTLCFVSCTGEKQPPALFERVPADASGIAFENRLHENDSINILDNEFVYNGSGVALGDLNGDGLDDIFLAGNQVNNALYLNQGKMKFKDVSDVSGIGKPDSLLWSSGVSLVDLNLDGQLDIYICNTFYRDSTQRRNLLYVHQGTDADGIPKFREAAAEYGIADDTYSSHAQFFDYDNDGDLDLFIGVNRIEGINPSEFRPNQDDGTSLSRDRLYENRWDEASGHPLFVDVSDAAGIRFHGYSHSTLIHDFNKDGWMDIYVANDFFSNDLVYINNQDGTFTNRAGDIFKHFSLSSMGSDLADINNDGELDLFTTEMQPYYNKRKKLFQGPSSYNKEIFTRRYDYEYQYARNTLQIANGTDPATGLPVYSETGMFAGIQETDWSWAPLFADYDNDGWQDLLITNGFPKDVTDRDFGDFRVTASRLVSKEKLIEAIPEIKIPNFAFRNMSNLTFKDVTEEWGLNFGTFSNGAAYGDLDQDGDLDLVINNLNEKALLLENHGTELHPELGYLRIRLNGTRENAAGYGSMVSVYSEGHVQKLQLLSGRGYLSKPESVLHFGLGTAKAADSVIVQWPDGRIQRLMEVPAGQTLAVNYSEAGNPDRPTDGSSRKGYLVEASDRLGLNSLIRDIDFIDFNFQRTIPHKFSQYGPSLATGDVNGDGLADLFVGGSRNFPEKWFFQQPDGTFQEKEANYKVHPELEEEDTASLLFDADGDGDLDLYLARGSGQYEVGDIRYQDVLMVNDGKGNFTPSTGGLPEMRANSSVAKAADFDHDGDLDLFIGSRVKPFAYPTADRSYILRNDSGPQGIRFTDVTGEVAEGLEYAGLISDALWTDFNGDFWPDLILAAEWSPLRFFENRDGKLREITGATGLADDKGWWNSLTPADLDNDGDIDYIAGNSGTNIYFKGSREEPVRIYAKDLDDNGMIDPLISYYLRDSAGVRREYLYHPWQDVVKQFSAIRKRFNSFGEFGASTLPEMFPDGLLNDALVYEFNTMDNSWIENLGGNRFARHPLPVAVQIAPVFATAASDFDQDGRLDVLMVGNDYGMEVQQGRADAFMGMMLRNTDKGFSALRTDQSGFYVPGDGKALVRVAGANGSVIWVASQNNDRLKAFEDQTPGRMLPVSDSAVRAIVNFRDGSKQVHEFYWGSGFHSQSGRFLQVVPGVESVEFYDGSGKLLRTETLEGGT